MDNLSDPLQKKVEGQVVSALDTIKADLTEVIQLAYDHAKAALPKLEGELFASASGLIAKAEQFAAKHGLSLNTKS